MPGAQAPSPAVAAAAIAADVDDGGLNDGGHRWWKEDGSGRKWIYWKERKRGNSVTNWKST